MSSATTLSRVDALARLGFPAGSTPSDAEIKKAFHKAVLKAHPDKPGGSSEAFGALTKAYELLTNPSNEPELSDESATKVDSVFGDFIANLLSRLNAEFGDENVTVTHTSDAHASASRGGHKVTCTTCGKQHLGVCRHAAPASASRGGKVTCTTCGKQHLGACRHAAPAAHASASRGGHKVTCTTCGKQHLGVCRHAKSA